MISISHLKSNDPDEISEILKDWNHEYIPLERSKYSWDIDLIEIDEFQIFEQSFGGITLAQGQLPPDTCGFAIPQIVSEGCLFVGQEVTFDTGFMSQYSQEYELKTGANHKHIVFIAPITQVLSCAKQMQYPLTNEDLTRGLVIPNPRAYQQFTHYLQELLILAKTQPQTLTDSIKNQSLKQLILADLLPLFVDVLMVKPVTYLPAKESAQRCLVKQATTLIKENIKHPISLTDLCQNIGKSQRSLYYGFQEAYGLAPMTYLKILRLNGIRQVLKSADPNVNTVTEIATDWGFWHIGQFCADYKKMFGETPATTLKQH